MCESGDIVLVHIVVFQFLCFYINHVFILDEVQIHLNILVGPNFKWWAKIKGIWEYKKYNWLII